MTRLGGIKRIRRQVSIVPEPRHRDQRRDDHSIAFGGIANEILAVDGIIHRLAQPYIVPWAPHFPSIENAEHRRQRATVFHHLSKGTRGHSQRLEWAQTGDQVDLTFGSPDELDSLFLAHGVVKDNPL